MLKKKQKEFEFPKGWKPGMPYPERIKELHFDEERKRWKARPKIRSCCKGVPPKWNEEGRSYQAQLFCVYYGTYINPNGYTCELCAEDKWPIKEHAKKMIEDALADSTIGRAEAVALIEEKILRMVDEGILTQEEAFEVIAETKLDEMEY